MIGGIFMDMTKSRIPVIPEELFKKIIKGSGKKYDRKKALKEAKKDLRKQGLFLL